MPKTANRPLKVFLSHAHADRDVVRALYTRLTKDGVDAWLDKENSSPARIGNWKSAWRYNCSRTGERL